MRRPPRSAPRGLVSLGRTISIISDWLSRTGRGAKFPAVSSIHSIILAAANTCSFAWHAPLLVVTGDSPLESAQPVLVGAADPGCPGEPSSPRILLLRSAHYG